MKRLLTIGIVIGGIFLIRSNAAQDFFMTHENCEDSDVKCITEQATMPNDTDTESNEEIPTDKTPEIEIIEVKETNEEQKPNNQKESNTVITKTNHTPQTTVTQKHANNLTTKTINPDPKARIVSIQSNIFFATVYAQDWEFKLSHNIIPAGTVHFTLKNEGNFHHGLVIRNEANEIISESVITARGEEASIILNLPAGKYSVQSPKRTDQSNDMIVPFLVQ